MSTTNVKRILVVRKTCQRDGCLVDQKHQDLDLFKRNCFYTVEAIVQTSGAKMVEVNTTVIWDVIDAAEYYTQSEASC